MTTLISELDCMCDTSSYIDMISEQEVLGNYHIPVQVGDPRLSDPSSISCG